jgi:hypothetical protein
MRNFIVLFLSSILYCSFNAQSFKALSDIQISISPVNGELEIDEAIFDNQAALDSIRYAFYHNEVFNVKVSVLLEDTLQVSKIYIKLGRTENGNDIFEDYYVFDNNSPGGNKTYFRNSNHIIMGLGNFQNLNNIYAIVYIESTIGTTSQVIQRQINL